MFKNSKAYARRGEIRLFALLLIGALFSCSAVPAQGILRDRIKQRFADFNSDQKKSSQKVQIAGLSCAVWRPIKSGQAPLVIFSHGFHGCNTQSLFLMEALASAGYLVIAPNHKDAIGNSAGGGFTKSEEPFQNAQKWTDTTYIDRRDDIWKLVKALHEDPKWNEQIDWSRFALAGHSLGGYTALALGGAWQSWKLPGVKAVLALSPYCTPFIEKSTLAKLNLPVMYQGGTRDLGITPFLKKPGGAFSQTPAPVCFVEFDKAGHFSFSNLNKDKTQEDLISHYSLAFLNKYLKSDTSAKPELKLDGVSELETKSKEL